MSTLTEPAVLAIYSPTGLIRCAVAGQPMPNMIWPPGVGGQLVDPSDLAKGKKSRRV